MKRPTKPEHWQGITEEEWQECVVLDYVLTWGYSLNPESDERRYAELQSKKVYAPTFGPRQSL